MLIPPVDQGLFGDTCYQASIFAQPQPVQYYYTETPVHANKSISNQVCLITTVDTLTFNENA